MIKSFFCFKRQSHNQPSCSFSQVSVLNQHKKHQEPKGGFLIKSGLMRLQAGGSLLSPEKYESAPQICKQVQEQGPVPVTSISSSLKSLTLYSCLTPAPPCCLPPFLPLFGFGFQYPSSFRKMSSGLFLLFSPLLPHFNNLLLKLLSGTEHPQGKARMAMGPQQGLKGVS